MYTHGFRKQRFQFATVIEVPGMKHAPPPPEWLDKGLKFLDTPK